MKKSKIISITVLLYCFGVAIAYCSSHILNVERTFLYTYFSLLFPQIIGIVTAFILFMKNQKMYNINVRIAEKTIIKSIFYL